MFATFSFLQCKLDATIISRSGYGHDREMCQPSKGIDSSQQAALGLCHKGLS
jgi:hypothetical protein